MNEIKNVELRKFWHYQTDFAMYDDIAKGIPIYAVDFFDGKVRQTVCYTKAICLDDHYLLIRKRVSGANTSDIDERVFGVADCVEEANKRMYKKAHFLARRLADEYDYNLIDYTKHS